MGIQSPALSERIENICSRSVLWCLHVNHFLVVSLFAHRFAIKSFLRSVKKTPLTVRNTKLRNTPSPCVYGTAISAPFGLRDFVDEKMSVWLVIALNNVVTFFYTISTHDRMRPWPKQHTFEHRPNNHFAQQNALLFRSRLCPPPLDPDCSPARTTARVETSTQ